MVAPIVVVGGVIAAAIIAGTLVDSANKGKLSVPIVGPAVDTIEAVGTAIESFAQLFAVVMAPQKDQDGNLDMRKAFKVWASTPALQLAAIGVVGAPAIAATAFAAPRMVEAVPNAMQTLADIDFKTPKWSQLSKKEQDFLKLGLGATGVVSGFWLYDQLPF